MINGYFSRSASSRYYKMGWWNLLLGRNPSYKHRCLISGAAAPSISTFTNRGNSPLSHTVDYAAWTTYDGIWTTSTISFAALDDLRDCTTLDDLLKSLYMISNRTCMSEAIYQNKTSIQPWCWWTDMDGRVLHRVLVVPKPALYIPEYFRLGPMYRLLLSYWPVWLYDTALCALFAHFEYTERVKVDMVRNQWLTGGRGPQP
jgi:hypothetical protein